MIAETARLTDARVELDDMEKERLNDQLLALLEVVHTQPEITATYFRQDQKKAGGAYIRTTGRVKKIDPCTNTILLTDGRRIPIGEIIEIIPLE